MFQTLVTTALAMHTSFNLLIDRQHALVKALEFGDVATTML